MLSEKIEIECHFNAGPANNNKNRLFKLLVKGADNKSKKLFKSSSKKKTNSKIKVLKIQIFKISNKILSFRQTYKIL